jgi:hypothetical protein
MALAETAVVWWCPHVAHAPYPRRRFHEGTASSRVWAPSSKTSCDFIPVTVPDPVLVGFTDGVIIAVVQSMNPVMDGMYDYFPMGDLQPALIFIRRCNSLYLPVAILDPTVVLSSVSPKATSWRG